MATYVIKDNESKVINKLLTTKWGKYPIDNCDVRGVINIIRYRKYEFRNEVDVEFEGEIFVRLNSKGRLWYKSDIMTSDKFNINKGKLNRYFRMTLFDEICFRMRYFGVDIEPNYRNINKIKWK
jgi:hypothetical protein